MSPSLVCRFPVTSSNSSRSRTQIECTTCCCTGAQSRSTRPDSGKDTWLVDRAEATSSMPGPEMVSLLPFSFDGLWIFQKSMGRADAFRSSKVWRIVSYFALYLAVFNFSKLVIVSQGKYSSSKFGPSPRRRVQYWKCWWWHQVSCSTGDFCLHF